MPIDLDSTTKGKSNKALIKALRKDIVHHKGEHRPTDYLRTAIKKLSGKGLVQPINRKPVAFSWEGGRQTPEQRQTTLQQQREAILNATLPRAQAAHLETLQSDLEDITEELDRVNAEMETMEDNNGDPRINLTADESRRYEELSDYYNEMSTAEHEVQSQINEILGLPPPPAPVDPPDDESVFSVEEAANVLSGMSGSGIIQPINQKFLPFF